MSETSITDKITDSISVTVTNVLKKSGISDKIDKIGFYIFLPFVGFILVGVYGFQVLVKENIKNHDENMILHNTNKEFIIHLNNKIDILNEKISSLEKNLTERLDNQQTTLNNISEIPLLNICNEKSILSSSSISLSIDEINEEPVTYINEHKEENIIEDKNDEWFYSKDQENDELINECYDNLPLNGVKKATGFKSLFWN